MKIFLNESELNEEYKSLSLPELLDEVKEDMDDEILKQIFVNGAEINEKYLRKNLLNEEDVQSIKFVTQKTEKLIKETLDEIDKYLPKLKEGTLDTADLFRNGEPEKANNKYQMILEGLEWYTQVTEKILSLIDNDKLSDDKTGLDDLNELLSEMMNAYQNGDFVLLADLLEYEIVNMIDDFIEFNEKIIELYNGKKE